MLAFCDGLAMLGNHCLYDIREDYGVQWRIVEEPSTANASMIPE